MDIMEKIYKKAASDKKKIVLPEADDIRTIKAAVEATKKQIADIILIGNKTEIEGKYSDYDLKGIKIIEPETFEKTNEYAKTLYELRKHKGMTEEKAKKLIVDPLFFSAVMIKEKDADGMVAGAVNSTADTLRPAFQIIKTAKDSKMVSIVYLIILDKEDFGYKGTMVYGDVAVIEDPTSEQLAYIAKGAAKLFKQLVQEEPKVAMLSYSTYGSAQSPMVDKVRKGVEIAKKVAPEYEIDGEMQFDAAVIPEIGQKKAPGSKVAGHANVLIFPDLEAGNIGYKITQRIGGAKAYPVTIGLASPVNDMSRGCSAEDIVGVIAITAIQAQGLKD